MTTTDGAATPLLGRRERKKAATRAAIADAALRLFLERGYDQVSVKDVAEAADVAVTTLFQHFGSKEALVFDRDDEREVGLVAAVAERGADQSALDALQAHLETQPFLDTVVDPGFAAFQRLIRTTPALREYHHRMWTRHEASLVAAITASSGLPSDDVGTALLVRAAFEALDLARDRPDPRAALAEAFDHLRTGWGDDGRTPAA